MGGIEDLSKDYYEIIAFTFSDTDYFCIWCDPEDGDPHFETKGKRLFFQLLEGLLYRHPAEV